MASYELFTINLQSSDLHFYHFYCKSLANSMHRFNSDSYMRHTILVSDLTRCEDCATLVLRKCSNLRSNTCSNTSLNSFSPAKPFHIQRKAIDKVARYSSPNEKLERMQLVLKQLYESPTIGNHGKGDMFRASLDIKSLADAAGTSTANMYRFLYRSDIIPLLEYYGIDEFHNLPLASGPRRYIYNPDKAQINIDKVTTVRETILTSNTPGAMPTPTSKEPELTEIEKLVLDSFFKGHYKTILEGNDNDKELVNKTITNALTDKSFAIKLVKVESNES